MSLFPKRKPLPERNKVGLVLGGGGARGFVEIGALKAFNERSIKFDMCVGTSVGSIVGALYAAKIPYEEILQLGEQIELTDLHGKILFKPDDPKKIGDLLYKLIGDAQIENLPIPFAAVATDLKTGKQIILDHGSVLDAVSASSAYPIFYRPLAKDGMNLSDGGLVNNIPTDVCKMLGADKVVAIDVARKANGSGTDGTGVMDMIKALFSIMASNASVVGRTQSDILIDPDTSAYSATSKNGYMEMVELGYRTALERCDDVAALFKPAAAK